jgi:hypothetical protein
MRKTLVVALDDSRPSLVLRACYLFFQSCRLLSPGAVLILTHLWPEDLIVFYQKQRKARKMEEIEIALEGSTWKTLARHQSHQSLRSCSCYLMS